MIKLTELVHFGYHNTDDLVDQAIKLLETDPQPARGRRSSIPAVKGGLDAAIEFLEAELTPPTTPTVSASSTQPPGTTAGSSSKSNSAQALYRILQVEQMARDGKLEAIRTLDLTGFPDVATLMQASALMRLGDLSEAITTLGQYVGEQPLDARGHSYLAKAKLDENDLLKGSHTLDDITKDATQAYKLAKDDARVNQVLSDVYEIRTKETAAKETLPDHNGGTASAVKAYTRAYEQFREGDKLRTAKKTFETVINLATGAANEDKALRAYAHHMIAEIELRDGNLHEAVVSLNKSITELETSKAYAALAEVHEKIALHNPD